MPAVNVSPIILAKGSGMGKHHHDLSVVRHCFFCDTFRVRRLTDRLTDRSTQCFTPHGMPAKNICHNLNDSFELIGEELGECILVLAEK